MNNTVIKTTKILMLIAQSNQGLTLSQIVRELGYPKSTVFNIVHTLCEQGMLTTTGDVVPTYLLGTKALQVGLSYLRQTSLDAAARPVLSRLCSQINETVFMSVRSGTADLVYVMKYLSDSEYQTICSIGTVRPLLSVAMGKAMLCALNDDRIKAEVTPQMLDACSIENIRNMDALLDWLQKAREAGFVIEDTSENPHSATTVAAPVLDINRQPVSAISAVIMHDTQDSDRIREIGELVKAAALEISRSLGFLGESLYP